MRKILLASISKRSKETRFPTLVGVLILVNMLILPFLVLGQVGGALPPVPEVVILGEGGVLDTITNYLFVILLAVAVIFIIIAGFYFIESQGDPQKYEKAKKMVLYSVIGVLVGFAAKGVVLLFKTMFGF